MNKRHYLIGYALNEEEAAAKAADFQASSAEKRHYLIGYALNEEEAAAKAAEFQASK